MKENFKTDKATRVLMLYHQLLGGHAVDKYTYSLEHGVNERTFDRDIETIRLFLSDIYSSDQLLFDRENNTYYLSGSRPVYMERMDVTVMAKILLDSNLLRNDEMQGLINVMLSSVKPYDAEVIKTYLSKDISLYESGTTKAILKFIGDLYSVIKAGQDIEVVLCDSEEEADMMVVYPLEIVCDEDKFCLLAARDFKLDNIIKIPIESIVNFKVLRTNYAEGLKKKYCKMKGV